MSGSDDYTLGSYSEVIPANTIPSTFFIMGAIVLDPSSGVEYVIDVSTGAALSESDVGTLSFKYGTTGGQTGAVSFQNDTFQSDSFDIAGTQSINVVPSQDPLFPVAIRVEKNTRVSARLATSIGGYTCKMKVKYKL